VPKGSPFSPTNFCRAEWTALAIHATDLAPSAARSPNEVGFGAPFAVAHPDEQTLGVDVAGLEGETSLRRRPSAWIVVSATRRTGWAEKTEDGPVALQRVQKEEPQRVDGEVDGRRREMLGLPEVEEERRRFSSTRSAGCCRPSR
jgi:hypothetical protein